MDWKSFSNTKGLKQKGRGDEVGVKQGVAGALVDEKNPTARRGAVGKSKHTMRKL